ncbi:hypothetical protein [Leptospira interrogans]|uniref:hypothetical protein n=1 Tax=Leptospira interrogans TaxID=173 RepID=UPI0002B95ADB|nr:hypothetical protein [Leptospira interrogans]EMN54779.1 hypothetical protein LEP1GSC089_2065 [Leptospira interrogans serovar Autumnalis str. LP101]MCR8647665.1 hypothetical protein [Leptospira interrogans serovar Bataviae]OAM85432.1 hypothetical protein A1343_18160 [Leptospira interrogans serovar Bataviae]QOI33587.1 hypothetical protein LeptoLang_04690 [Leptospira interrogans serovar Icterohaemorrhagiae]QOI36889.1 hypothetical protein Lepto1548_00300 [Leptospira interrogans serovar Bataviae
MSPLEISELILGYTIFWTLLIWFCVGLLALLLWWFLFRVLFREPININVNGYQPIEMNEDGNKFPPQEESGGN